MKKLAALVGSAALLLSMTGVVMAHRRGGDDVSIRNYGRVTNDIETRADSGDNSIGGKLVRGGRIETGKVEAYSDIFTDVNSTVLGCGCTDDLSIRNYGKVRNDVETKADSGDNSIHGRWVSGGKIDTGKAFAGTVVETIVNFTMVAGEEG